MFGVNLHAVVRGAITSIYPDETCTLYQANGQRNNKGLIQAVYLEPQEIQANIQPLDADRLKHMEKVNDMTATEQIFAYSDTDNPITGIKRVPILRSGDFIQRADGTYWLITDVYEDWSSVGWCNAGITQQVTPPDFSGCEWSNTVGSAKVGIAKIGG